MAPKRQKLIPDMGAVKIPQYTCRQSRYPHAPPLPLLGLCVGPSMSGKSNFLVKLVTEVYRHKDGKSCFDRIYVFSPSVHVDPIWKPVKDMIESEILDMMNPNHAKEQYFFDEPDFKAMEEIIDAQFAIIELSRQKKRKEENQILILIDDFSSEPEMTRSNRLVNKLYTRGRHARISTVCSVHRTKNVLNPIIRAQATALFIFRQKAFLELQAFLEENSATVGKDVLEKVYRLAVSQPFQFLYVNLKTLDINEMFYIGFQQRIRITEQ